MSPTDFRERACNVISVAFGGLHRVGEVKWDDMFACGKDDTFATKFTAKNTAVFRVSGVVCCGMLKSCTVRF